MIPSIHNLCYFLIPVFLIGCFFTAGCTQPFTADNMNASAQDNPGMKSVARYQLTLAQPEDSAKMVRMDTDVYNLGEVVEFIIVNEKTSDLSCVNDPPSFSVRYQQGTGRWVTRMGVENPAPGNTTSLKPGESTTPYRFVTTGWAVGRYRIVTDCGVSREILLRSPPSVAPAVTSCPLMTNTTPFIRINPISDQYAGERFTISGTTSLAAGEEIQYSLYASMPLTGNVTPKKLISSTIWVAGGSCGINTWSVDGQIAVPGSYVIGISNQAGTVSAVRQFAVLANTRGTTTAAAPAKTTAPGITTG